jgi:hypothetical protein
MATQKLNLTRDQLATFLKNQEQIKQFERLFAVVDEVAPSSDTTLITIQAGNADAAATEALAQIVRLSQDAAINSSAADQKAVQALDTLGRIANALEMLATAPVIQNNNSVVTDYIDFSNQAPHVDRIRRLAWNDSDQTLDLGMEYGVIQQIGQETYARVENTTGVTIPNGTVVGFVGVGANNTLSVAPYLADGSTPTLYILGVMTHDLPDSGEVGYCNVWGHVRTLDTSAFAAGDILYASPTVAGAFTNVKPTAPDNVIPLAAVLKVGVTDGEIFVRPTIEQERYYGEFYNSAGVTPVAANTAYALAWSGTTISDGVTIAGSPVTQITVSESGLYQFNARMQFNSGNSNTKSAWIWWKLNGTTNYSNSATIGTLSDNNGYLVLRNSQFFSLAAGDYIELMWAVDDTNLAPINVASTAFAPAAACAVVEVTQIQQ